MGSQWLILIGACFFILMLAISAYWEADIRWLHFFQAWMYLATILLSFRRSRWGYFIGISAAGLWDYTNIFATTFLYNGLEQIANWIRSGHLQRPDLLIAIPHGCQTFWWSSAVSGAICGSGKNPGLTAPSSSWRLRGRPASSRWTCISSSPDIWASSHGCFIRDCPSRGMRWCGSI